MNNIKLPLAILYFILSMPSEAIYSNTFFSGTNRNRLMIDPIDKTVKVDGKTSYPSYWYRDIEFYFGKEAKDKFDFKLTTKGLVDKDESILCPAEQFIYKMKNGKIGYKTHVILKPCPLFEKVIVNGEIISNAVEIACEEFDKKTKVGRINLGGEYFSFKLLGDSYNDKYYMYDSLEKADDETKSYKKLYEIYDEEKFKGFKDKYLLTPIIKALSDFINGDGKKLKKIMDTPIAKYDDRKKLNSLPGAKDEYGVLYFEIGAGGQYRKINYEELITTKGLIPFFSYLKDHIELMKDYDLFIPRLGVGDIMYGYVLEVPLLYSVKNPEVIVSSNFGQMKVLIKLDDDTANFEFFDKGFNLDSEDNTKSNTKNSKKEKNN